MELIEEFQTEYLQIGWEIISSVNKILVLLTISAVLIFLGPNHPFYWRALTIWPTCFILFCIVDKYFSKNKRVTEFLLISLAFLFGFAIIQGNIKKSTYSFYELWIVFMFYCQYLGVFLFLKWIKGVISFYIITIVYVVMLNIYYDEVSFVLYVSLTCVCVLYPITCMFISQKLKEMLILLKSNRDLVHTIQTILKIFPEGVIIRSIDPISQKIITQYANDNSLKFIMKENEKLNISEHIEVKVQNERNNHYEYFHLDDFINLQESKSERSDSCINQMIEIKDNLESSEENKDLDPNNHNDNNQNNFNLFYSIKTIKVNWKNRDSFMHVFVNTTQIKRLEEERANRECQQLMFASLSHDMRTPLNAFSNSLKLIDLTFDEVKKKILKHREINESYEVLQPRLQKYFKIGEISSCLLLNLVEDILDMAKFSAKTFQLNIEPFKLESVLKEIEFIFGFQCAEKRLGFRIHCDEDINDEVFNSDPKRLKQVLINLVSNSFKFTERGRITITVSKIIEMANLFLKFEVHDTGVGINKKDIPKLFNLFGMLDKHRKKLNKSGSGLGLSISKKIVESLGGYIKVISEEGSWTKFEFTIKCENQELHFAQEESKQNHILEEVLFDNLFFTYFFSLH